MKPENIQSQGKQFAKFYKNNPEFDVMGFGFSIKKIFEVNS